MLTRFFYTLRAAGLQPSVTEFLALLEALQAGLAALSLDEFYLLARTCLIKDETRYDRYDRAFATFFQGVSEITVEQFGDVPAQARVLLLLGRQYWKSGQRGERR